MLTITIHTLSNYSFPVLSHSQAPIVVVRVDSFSDEILARPEELKGEKLIFNSCFHSKNQVVVHITNDMYKRVSRVVVDGKDTMDYVVRYV